MGLNNLKKGLLFIQLRAACDPLVIQGIYLSENSPTKKKKAFWPGKWNCLLAAWAGIYLLHDVPQTTSHLLSSDTPSKESRGFPSSILGEFVWCGHYNTLRAWMWLSSFPPPLSWSNFFDVVIGTHYVLGCGCLFIPSPPLSFDLWDRITTLFAYFSLSRVKPSSTSSLSNHGPPPPHVVGYYGVGILLIYTFLHFKASTRVVTSTHSTLFPWQDYLLFHVIVDAFTALSYLAFSLWWQNHHI